MGIRDRKQSLILAVKAHYRAGKLTQEETESFELMYRRCRSTQEQDAVTKALHNVLEGWRTDRGSAYAHLRRLREGVKLPEDLDEEDPPTMQAALANGRVDLKRR